MSGATTTREHESAEPADSVSPVSFETTRMLCAATHVDEQFCRHVIDTVVDDPLRAIAPSYGVDLPAVARHALAARRRRWLRDVLLAVLGLAILIVVVGVVGGGDRLDADGAPAELVLPVLALLAAAWLVVALERWITRSRVLPALVDEDVVAPRLSRRNERRLATVPDVRDANVIVFSGFNPFVGSGAPLGSWSFAIDVTKGVADPHTGRPRTPAPFSAADLHDHMQEALAGLGLPELRVEHRLFVDGRDLRGSRLLPHRQRRPENLVEDAAIRDTLGDTESAGRGYLALEAIGWNGQLVVTMFFRAVRLEGSVFLEGSAFGLMPLREEYVRAGRTRTTSAVELAVSEFGAAAVWTLPALVLAPFRLWAAVRRGGGRRSEIRRRRELIAAGKVVDYGARTSLREDATGQRFNRYFLKLDHEMYVKVAQERLLRSVSVFLREHNVDTDEFARQQTVINRNQTVNVSPSGSGNVTFTAGDQSSVQQGSEK